MANSAPKGSRGFGNAGGRKKGVPNKRSGTIRERVEALGGDYLAYLVHTMMNNIPCGVCRGEGKTKFQPGANSVRFQGVRTCQSCWGSKLEKIAPEASQRAATTLMEYCEAKRKAIEISGPDGGPMQAKVTVEFVSATPASIPASKLHGNGIDHR